MELVTKKRLTIVSGRVNRELAEEVADRLGQGLGPVQIAEFANGELHCKYGESIRGADLFIFGSHSSTAEMSVNDAIMEHMILVDAAKRASAKRITVVAPFYGYGRQDRKAEGREPITAKLLANMFEVAGAKRIVVGRPALGSDPGVLRRTGRPPDGHAGPGRLDGPEPGRRPGGRLARRRPGEGGRALRQPAARRSGDRAQAAHQGREEPGRGEGGRRRGRGPHLRAHRRHDRHRRDHRRSGRAAQRAWRQRGVLRRHPRGVLGAGHRPTEELLDREGRDHQHAAAAAPRSGSTRSRSSPRRGSSPTRSTPCSRSPRCRRSSTVRTRAERLASLGATPIHSPVGPEALDAPGTTFVRRSPPTSTRRDVAGAPGVLPCPRSRSPPRPAAPPAPARPADSAPRAVSPAWSTAAGKPAETITFRRKDLRHALNTDAGRNALVRLEFEGQSFLTLVREIQRHPVRRDVTHVDFLKVDETKPVELEHPDRPGRRGEAGQRHGWHDRAAAERRAGAGPSRPDPRTRSRSTSPTCASTGRSWSRT